MKSKLQINLSFDRAMPDTPALVHQGKLKSCTNDRHLYREVYLLVMFSIRTLERSKMGNVHRLLGLDRRPLSYCVSLSSGWFPIIACED